MIRPPVCMDLNKTAIIWQEKWVYFSFFPVLPTLILCVTPNMTHLADSVPPVGWHRHVRHFQSQSESHFEGAETSSDSPWNFTH